MSSASPNKKNLRLWRLGAALMGLPCLAALGFFAWQSFYPVSAAAGWSVQVVHRDVEKAASLMPLPDGSLMVSQELAKGKGSIVRIHRDGARDVVVANLSKPDGMFATRGGWVFSQESGGLPVSFFKDGVVTELFKGENVQGLWDEGDDLYAIEDRKPTGRLLRYRWSDQSLSVLRDQVQEGESIVRCADGRMLYTEKKKGVVRELSADGSDPVVLAGLNKPTFLMCDERGLWVNEDSTHRARLLLVDPQGKQQTILSFLKAPQSIVPTGRGTYLLAEGGRNRVLELVPQGHTVTP
jgi:glucose/arabinose dehydrogenase